MTKSARFLERIMTCLSLAALPVISGCQHTHYEVELTPNGKQVTRQITVWRERNRDDAGVIEFDEVPGDILTKVAEAYGEDPPPPAAKKHQFIGEFAGELPDDLGGKGWYVHWDSPLGATTAYSERVRGDDDFVDEVARRQAAASELADLLVGWADAEMKEGAEYDALRKFLDVELRRDLRNLALYWWTYTTTADGQSHGSEEALVRMGHYLAERGYFDPQEAPLFVRGAQELVQEDPYRLLRLTQRIVCRKLGHADAEPIPKSLQFLADPVQLTASAARYLKTTERYQKLLEAWEREVSENPDHELPSPTAVLAQVAAEAFPVTGLLGGGDELKVRLALPVAPLSTNGAWNSGDKAVTWSRSIWAGESEHPLPPTLLYAIWAEPNAMLQETYFGRVVLQGRQLADYCMWYAGLSDDDARQWDTFLSTLRPDVELAERVGTFRFANEPPFAAEPEYNSHADHAISLIRTGLEASN